MQELGADIPKIAVMPRCPGDVIALLDATQEMKREVRRPAHHHHVHGGRGGQPPVRGVLRLGHDLRRGGPGLRPGQIPVEELNAAMDILHRALAPGAEGEGDK